MCTSAKSFFIIIFFLILSNISSGQRSNIILFSENGERFSVVLNGVLQNSSPETNIKITDLTAPSYKLKILFEDTKLAPINKNLMLGQDLEITYCIKMNNKNQYVVRFQNQIEIRQAPPPPPSQRIFAYSTIPVPTNSSVTQSQTTVTTLNNVNNSGGNINININSGINNEQVVEKHDHYIMPGYQGPIGCPFPLTDLDFENVKRTIADKSFEESKLKIAKQVTSSNCLFASEVKEIMDLFSFENTKLDFAKFAYGYTYDIGNYYKVNDAFHFESSINELAGFIEGKNNK